jgi:hypothetical protein
LLSRENATKNREIVHDHADIPDQGVVIRGAGVVVGVVMLPVVVPVTSPVPSSARQLARGDRGGDCYGPEDPTSHKSNINYFGPHRSMFLSIDVNRAQHATGINFVSSSKWKKSTNNGN